MGKIADSRKTVTNQLRKEFQERFLAYFKLSGLKYTYVADRMKWSKQAVHQLGVGRAMPTITTLHVVANVLGFPPDRLFPTGKGDEWKRTLDFDASYRRATNLRICPPKFKMSFKKTGDV